MLPFSRRIKLFLFGLLAGTLLVYFILFRGRDRGYWLPGNRVKEQIQQSQFTFSERAKCKMKCKGISREEVEEILKKGKVNFSESNARAVPVPSYALEGISSGNKKLRVIITIFEKDSIAEVTTVINLNEEKDTCICQ